ncbi:MAG: methyltransferase [Candidatus Aenigmatarchaeota archaeon]
MRDEAIFIPLPKNTIRKMLKLAKVKKNDVLYDLGSGDGRVLILATKEFGCKAIGIEKNFLLYLISKIRIKRENLTNKIKVVHGDFFKERLSQADVIFMYLSKKIANKLKLKFRKELKRGARIVTADHKIEGWQEIKKIKTGHFYSYLYKV